MNGFKVENPIFESYHITYKSELSSSVYRIERRKQKFNPIQVHL